MPSPAVRVKVRLDVGPNSVEYDMLVNDPDLNSWQKTPDHTVYAAVSRMFQQATDALIPKSILTDD